MKAPLRPHVAVILALSGAITGWLITLAALPYLRQVDPLGISPIVLISVMGGLALGWYLRGCAESVVAPDQARINITETS